MASGRAGRRDSCCSRRWCRTGSSQGLSITDRWRPGDFMLVCITPTRCQMILCCDWQHTDCEGARNECRGLGRRNEMKDEHSSYKSRHGLLCQDIRWRLLSPSSTTLKLFKRKLQESQQFNWGLKSWTTTLMMGAMLIADGICRSGGACGSWIRATKQSMVSLLLSTTRNSQSSLQRDYRLLYWFKLYVFWSQKK